MNKVNSFLMMLIAMVAIMLIAVGIDKGYSRYQDVKWEKERVAVYEEARADIEAMQTTIKTLSQDPEALSAYIEENQLNYVEDAEKPYTEEYAKAEDEKRISDNDAWEGEIWEEDRSGSDVFPDTVSDDGMQTGSISQNAVFDDVSGNTASDSSISGNFVSGNSISGNTASGNLEFVSTVSGLTVSGNYEEEKRRCASYEETLKINAADEKTIADNSIDFSDMKIACLGDSLTAAANLEKEDNYEQMTYPYLLRELLGAEEVVNLGIGGSSIGRYWENAFVDRYESIPEDTDLIIVMGGTNDGFCASERELGTLEERKTKTFAGDLDELLRNLKEDYPDAVIVLATPLSNVLHDMLRKERNYLLPQAAFVKMMKRLAEEYEVPVIDLYYSGLLDTHDAAIIHNFMPDGVHGNEEGYRILAQHMAAEIIRLYEGRKEQEDFA